MKALYFFVARGTGECFAVDPHTLHTFRLDAPGTVQQTSLEHLGLPGGLYKTRKALAQELEPLRAALETVLKDRVAARKTQAPSYISHYLARERVDLPAELAKERQRAADKRKRNRDNNRLKGIRPYTAVKRRRDKKRQLAMVHKHTGIAREEE